MFKRNCIKCVLAVLVACILLASTVFAAPVAKSVKVAFNNIKVYVGNTQVKIIDDSGKSAEPFTYNGTVYAPVKSLAKALGRNAQFDAKTNRLNITVPATPTPAASAALPKKLQKEPKTGDIIGIEGEYSGYKYEHYGVYAGNNKVIHYTSPTGKAVDAQVTETDMEPHFPKGKYFVLDLSPVKEMKILKAEEVIERAKFRLGEKSYDLIINNCEHFSLWCKTGTSRSLQIEALTLEQLKLLKSLMVQYGISLGI